MTRREALAASSPPMRVLLGVLLVETLVCVGTLAWNVIDIVRHCEDFGQNLYSG